MGRVDEALRRAAEKADAGLAPPPSPVADTAFPDEYAPEARLTDALAGQPVDPELVPVPVAEAIADEPDEPDEPIGADVKTSAQVGSKILTHKPMVDMASKLVGDDRMLTTSREQYRRLAATLHHLQMASGIKVVLIASAVAGEGKTLTAANLALTFSASYQKRVLLIDADLRRPSLARTFNVAGTPGLSDGLVRGHEGPLPLHQVSTYLSVLPAGKATPDPMAGLTSVRMQQLLTEARDGFDWVVIDTPPIGLMTDASLIAAMADGVVLVVKANTTPYHLVQRAAEALGEGKVLGTVLNRARDGHHHSKYYDYYHYAPVPPKGKTR